MVTYGAVGTYTMTLTVYDQVGQSASDTGVITVEAGDPPAAALSGPDSLDETAASLAEWTGWYEALASFDDYGIADYSIDWSDGSTSSLGPLADNFEDGNYTSDPVWTVYGGTWNVSNGILQQTNTGNAWRWLQDDPACVEICDWLGLDQGALIAALKQRETSVA